MLASVYALTFLLRGAGIAAPEASALADAACARRTLFGRLKCERKTLKTENQPEVRALPDEKPQDAEIPPHARTEDQSVCRDHVLRW